MDWQALSKKLQNPIKIDRKFTLLDCSVVRLVIERTANDRNGVGLRISAFGQSRRTAFGIAHLTRSRPKIG